MTPIDLARWLVEAGAGASALNVLGTMRGSAANRLRLAAVEARLPNGIYALMALPDGPAIVVPLRPTPGHPRAGDDAFRQACVEAHARARGVLNDPALPMLRFEFEEELAVIGPSIGLPAALAFIAYFTSTAPSHVVLAAGELSGTRLLDVGQIEAKHAIARLEAPNGLLLLPVRAKGGLEGATYVQSFAEASALVFGEEPLRADNAHSAVDEVIHRARRAAAPEGIVILESLDLQALAPADRARVMFDLGSYHRNLGHSHTAARIHREASALLDRERDVIGGEAAERYQLEAWATELDEFELLVRGDLRDRLSKPFLKLRNELRCRGMLSQAFAMNGDFEWAYNNRVYNLKLHDRSASLERNRPATLCHLVLEGALAGKADGFEDAAKSLFAVTRPGDEAQWRWNATAVVRGLVALGRDDLALRWVHDETTLHGVRVPHTLSLVVAQRAPEVTAPEISAVRAILRALRRVGRIDEARSLGERTLAAAGSPTELAGFVAALLEVELALVDPSRALPVEKLRFHHEAAARRHEGLLARETAEEALDQVWL